MPRIVRLGRAANDNARPPVMRTRAIVIALLTLLALAVAATAERLF